MKFKLYFTLSLCLFTIGLKSQSWVLDSLFAQNGIYQSNVGSFHFHSEIKVFGNRDLSISGKIISPFFQFGGENCEIGLSRINNCGQTDSLFGVNGRFITNGISYFPEKTLYNTDQSVFVVGGDQYYTPFLMKIDSQGLIDQNFIFLNLIDYSNILNTTISGKFLNVEIDSINQIIRCIGTYHKEQDKEYGALLMNFNYDGTIDTSIFNSNTSQIPLFNLMSFGESASFSKCSKVDSSRYILTGCSYSRDSLIIGMINKNGSVDSTFALNGLYIDSTVNIAGQTSRIFDIFSEVISNKIFITTHEIQNGISILNTRKFNLNGTLDSTFGVNGILQIIPDSIGTRIIRMKKVFDNKLLLSHLSYNDSVNNIITYGDFIIFDENGIEFTDFEILLSNSNFNSSNLLINDIFLESDSNIYIAATNFNNQLVVMKFTQQSYVPHLTFSGDSIFSNVTLENGFYEWQLDGEIITGLNSPNILFQGNGNYKVTVFESLSCNGYSDTISVQTVNLNPISDYGISVFPNPTNDFINIESNRVLNSIFITDISGKDVLYKVISSKSFKIDISFLKPGVYFLHLENSIMKLLIE